MNIDKLLDNIINQVNKDIVTALETDVTEAIKEKQVEVVYDEVYDVSEPRFYERRYENKGLIDTERNMNGNVVANNGEDITYIFENTTKTNPYQLIPNSYLYVPVYEGLESDESLLEYFEENNIVDLSQATLDELESSGVVVETLKNNLKQKGYNVD